MGDSGTFAGATQEQWDKWNKVFIGSLMKNIKEKEMKEAKEYKRVKSFTIKQILDEYGKKGNKMICSDAELEVRIWAEGKLISEVYNPGSFGDALTGKSFAGHNAIEWLAANTPYYEEVKKEPQAGDIVRMCDMKPGQTGVVVEGAYSNLIGRYYKYLDCDGLNRIIEVNGNDWFNTSMDGAVSSKVRLCDLDIREKVEGEKVIEDFDYCGSYGSCRDCPREEGFGCDNWNCKIIFTPKANK